MKLRTFVGVYLAVGVVYAASGLMVVTGKPVVDLLEVIVVSVLGWPLWLVLTYVMPLFCDLTPYACL